MVGWTSRHRGIAKSAAALVVAAAALTATPPAHGYVRYRTASGLAFAWKSSCVRVTAFPAAVPNLTRDQSRGAMAGAVAAWSKQDPALAACSYLDLMLTVAAETAVAPPAQNDGTNSIVFRQNSWSHDLAAVALTSVAARTSTGEIVDADIEINAFNFSWADLAATPAGPGLDLQSALAHEVGHLIGLDHTCDSSGAAVRPTDQNGNPIPDCASAPADVIATTMFPGDVNDTNKRTLAPDDQMGVCGAYPLASDPMSCPPPTPPDAGSDGSTSTGTGGTGGLPVDAGSTAPSGKGCGCAVSGRQPSAVILLLAVSPLLFRRRPRGFRRADQRART